jgi:hypothetical protein
VIAAERKAAKRRTLVAWHQNSPSRSILDVADPPRTDGRYHRKGGRRTWYGSSSRDAAWAELTRNPPQDVNWEEASRRIGEVSFDLLVLDLTNLELLSQLGLTATDLVVDDRSTCQALADVAADAGFEAVLGPSAAASGESTLAVFGSAIRDRATDVRDLGVHRAPPRRQE